MLPFNRHTLLRVAAYSLLVVITVDCDPEPQTTSGGCTDIYGLEGSYPPPPLPPRWSNTYWIESPEVLGGVSGTEVFGGGPNGSMFRFDGSRWSRMSQDAAPGDIHGVWAFDQNHVFAVGEFGTLIFFDGQEWTAMDVEWGAYGGVNDPHHLYSVWGTSPTDVFACGSDRTILHYDGASWTTTRISGDYGNFTSVFGVAPDDVFVVSYNVPEILHFTGAGWEQMPSGTMDRLYDVWAASARDAYAVGDYGAVVHFDGELWTPLEKKFGSRDLSAVWGSSGDDVYVLSEADVAYHYSAATGWVPTRLGLTGQPTDIWGASSDDVFISRYGIPHAYMHYDGIAWGAFPIGISASFTGVWTSSAQRAFVVGKGGTILRRVEVEPGQAYSRVWLRMDSGTTDDLTGIRGLDSGGLLAVGNNGTILRHSGSQWSRMDSGTSVNLTGVWGNSMQDATVVGGAGTILRASGGAWVPMTSGTTIDLTAVWGTSRENRFVVGKQGLILRHNGSGWKRMNSGTTADLACVWGASENNVYAVGANNTVLRYNGSSWRASPIAPAGSFTSVWGSSSSQVFIAGDTGLYGYFGERFRLMDPTANVLRIHGSSSKHALAVTSGGEILQYYPGDY